MMRYVAVLLVVVATVVAWPAAAVPVPAEADGPTAESSPGAAFSGALAVHEADLETEMEARVLDQALLLANRSGDPSRARAAILAEHLDGIRQRLATLEQRRQALEADRANGEIGNVTYAVRKLTLTLEVQENQRLLARSRAAAGALPSPVREEYDLTNATFQAVLNRSRTVTDGESTATTIVLEYGGSFVWNGTLTWSGAWEKPATWEAVWNRSTLSPEQLRRIDEVSTRLASLSENRSALERYDDGDDPEVREALDCARREIDQAQAAIDDAEAAADRGDRATLRRHLEDARSHLRQAAECLTRGWEAAYEKNSSDSRQRSWNGSNNWTYNSSKSS